MKTLHPLFAAAGLLGTVLLGGATVTYYEESLPTTMNPLFARTMVDFRSHELIFDRLVFRSAINNELRSRVLVENAQAPYVKLERLEGGLAVKLWVKEGVKWHDGEKFGPDDLCFTVNAMLDETTPSPIAKSFREAISGCENVKGESAVIVRFKKAFHQPLEHLQFSVLPKHSFQGTSISPDLDFSSRPIGTGPMKGAKGRKEVKFEAFANIHHGPKIDILSLNEGGDPFVQVRTLLSGGVHGVISVAPPLRPDVAAADDVALKSYDLRSWWFIAVNTGKGALKDKRVRQALNMTIDRNELRELTIGVDPNDDNPPCEFISGPFVQSSPYYNRQIKPVEKSDRATARTLMTASGASENAGRWMWTDGQPITLKIGMNAPLDAEAKDLLNQVGNQFQAGGFDRTVYKITQDDWARKAVTGQMTDFDLLIGKWSFGQVEDVNPLFHSRTKDGKGALNVFNYNSTASDAILSKFDNAKTDTEARDAYHELHASLADDLPYLFLWKLDTKSAWRNEIRNNTISPYYYFTEFDGWRYEGAATPTGG
jgi:peptide/nickel transport system substrate-binding protein